MLCAAGGGPAATQPVVLLLGLDGAGKTKLLYHMKLGPLTQLTRGSVDFEPTPAMNYEVVKTTYRASKYNLHVWDLTGNVHLRSMWHHYSSSAHVDVVMFVVDANDRQRFDEAREAFQQVLHSPVLAGALKLVLLNVKGPDAEDSRVLAQLLGVPTTNKHVHLEEVRPNEDNKGIQSALDWVCHSLRVIRGVGAVD